MAPNTFYSATNGNAHNHQYATNGDTKPTILHLGEPIAYNEALHTVLKSQFTIIRPPLSSLTRTNFIKHLEDKTWGDFSAIMRPFWNTGGEMGRWDRELIDLLPQSMQVMASAGAGFDWVDVDVLGEYGILYTNGAGASTESVADMALYHILSVFRQMTWTSQAARSGDRHQFELAHTQVPAFSHNPQGHTLGIIGLGNIGLAIAKKVKKALEMKIIYTDVIRKSPEQEREIGAIYFGSLDALLAESDCVLIATPHGRPLLTSRTLALLPRGARVVNIARGSLIDENALADALDSGHVSAAGLDVHMKEPFPSQRLSGRRDVMMTCHTGGGSVETIKGFEKLAMQNVRAVLNGDEPLTCVNKHFLRPRANANREHVNGYANGQTNVHVNSDENDAMMNGTRHHHNNVEATVVNNASGSGYLTA